MAATVCTDAASAVCAINTLMVFGSSGGMGVGVAREGTHPMTSDKVVKQINSFSFVGGIFPFLMEKNSIWIFNL
jgi:hypothetical protein